MDFEFSFCLSNYAKTCPIAITAGFAQKKLKVNWKKCPQKMQKNGGNFENNQVKRNGY